MSTCEYMLYIATDLPAAKVLEEMCRCMGVEPSIRLRALHPRTWFECSVSHDCGVWADSRIQEPDSDLGEFAKLLSLPERRYVRVHFNVLHFIPEEGDFGIVAKLAGCILRRVPGDCALTLDDHLIPAFVRHGDVTSIDRKLWSWLDEDIDALGVPVVETSLPYGG